MKTTIKNLENLESKTKLLALLMVKLGIKSANISVEEVDSFVSVNLKTCREDADDEFVYLFNESIGDNIYELDNTTDCNDDSDLYKNSTKENAIEVYKEQVNKESIEDLSQDTDEKNSINDESNVSEDKIKEENIVAENKDLSIENSKDDEALNMPNKNLDLEDEVCPGQVGLFFDEEEGDCEYEDIDMATLKELNIMMSQNDFPEDDFDEEEVSQNVCEEEILGYFGKGNDKVIDDFNKRNDFVKSELIKKQSEKDDFDEGKLICSVIQNNNGVSMVKGICNEDNMVCPTYNNRDCKSNEFDKPEGNSRKQYEEESGNKANKTCNEGNEVKRKKTKIIDFRKEDNYQKSYLKELFKNM